MQSRRQHRVWQKSENDKPDSNISQLRLLREAFMDTNMSLLMYFLMCFSYIIIFVYKVLTHLSHFGFTLYTKKWWLKCCIVCTAKHVHLYTFRINSVIGGVGFVWPTLYWSDLNALMLGASTFHWSNKFHQLIVRRVLTSLHEWPLVHLILHPI